MRFVRQRKYHGDQLLKAPLPYKKKKILDIDELPNGIWIKTEFHSNKWTKMTAAFLLFGFQEYRHIDKTFPIQIRASTWVMNWEKNRITLWIEVLPSDPYLFMDITSRYYWSLTVWKECVSNLNWRGKFALKRNKYNSLQTVMLSIYLWMFLIR